jgi:hypothetical protein
MSNRFHVDFTITLKDGEKEVVSFSAMRVHPQDIYGVLNTHAAYILQTIRDRDAEDRTSLRSE